MTYKYRGPVTGREFETLDDVEYQAWVMEAQNAAANVIGKHGSTTPEFRYQLAKELLKAAKTEIEAKAPKQRELEQHASSVAQPRDDATGQFANRGQLQGAGNEPSSPSLYDSAPVGGRRTVEW